MGLTCDVRLEEEEGQLCFLSCTMETESEARASLAIYLRYASRVYTTNAIPIPEPR